MVEFESCLSTGATEAQINNDIKQAKSLGVVGTPAFAVGVLRLNGQVLVQKIIGGAKPLETFQQAIENIHME
jgi:protein-disulfide isomerase